MIVADATGLEGQIAAMRPVYDATQLLGVAKVCVGLVEQKNGLVTLDQPKQWRWHIPSCYRRPVTRPWLSQRRLSAVVPTGTSGL